MLVTIDLETRSRIDLKKCGAYKYAEHESTDVLCLAFKVDDELEKLWVPARYRPLALDASLPLVGDDMAKRTIEKASVIEAHNANFERVLWANVMTKKYGFPPLPLEKVKCSAAKAAAHALPRSLDRACSALALPIQKDKTGYSVMLRMCKPNKFGNWNEDPTDFVRLCRYCMQDVAAEHMLSKTLRDMDAFEWGLWRLDQVINDRGISIDVPSVRRLVEKLQTKEQNLLVEIQSITGGAVRSARQRDKMLEWLRSEGTDTEDLQKQTVTALLEDLPESNAKRVLEIRQTLAKSSTAKLDTMLRMLCADGKVRGTLLFHGASTGRWAGKGIQVQNFPRESLVDSDLENAVNLPTELVEILYDDQFKTASKCLRGMLVPAPGKRFICSDFSAIEARVTAWIAGEEKVIEAFRSGKDVYKVAASDIYGVPYDKINKDQRQIGKVAVLALGFQGWTGAFQNMAKNYGVNVSEDRAAEIILAWREKHPRIVDLWKGLEDAALAAVLTGESKSYGRIKFGTRGGFLFCRLPSGRLLAYYKPHIKTVTTKYGKTKQVIGFIGSDAKVKWGPQATYGGKLTENCFGGETKVITDRGLKPIAQVTRDDRVFDGVEYVRHGGVICQGIKPVGSWLGVQVTGNHLIQDGRSWKSVTALDAVSTLRSLTWARDSAPWLCSFRETSGIKRFAFAIAERVTGLKPGSLEEARRIARVAGTKLRGEKEQNTRASSATNEPKMIGSTDTRGLYPDATIPNQKLLKTTAQEASECTAPGSKTKNCFSSMLKRFRIGIARVLTSIESTMGKVTNRETFDLSRDKLTAETEGQPSVFRTEGKISRFLNFGKSIAQNGAATILLRIILGKGARQKTSWKYTENATVYDVTNAGPRNQFVVITEAGPVIAHNCVQAIARDMLAEAMFRAEAAGYPVTFHCHDEIVSEVDEGFGSLEEFNALLAQSPEWAKDCPIGAEGWVGQRYKK